ncbi:isocitrate dehydrogenase [NAD] subunit gamma, mitochondrial-like [Portunus trituberculatus]|uniref:isocitrate dehydrogenase [NAD] subunit gamma, mitochondrial-like n=1 Tax=Portunus trituberculatus TaxID=210409 RepID=UPI001E1CC3B8|nr:isocitrate dehydrogenase [NAD] subunit gamma, mitochondrial-like [Portunus trituberculatus]
MATLGRSLSSLPQLSSLSLLPRLPQLLRDAARVTPVCPQRGFTAAKPFPVAQYGGRFTVTMIPGDGIGPEMMGYVRNIFRYAGVPVDFEEVQITKNSTEDEFEKALVCIKRNGVALKGSIESKYGDVSFSSRNATLRTQLDLFANVLHCRSHPALPSRYPDLDIVLIRENTEGEYSMLEHENVRGVVESMKVITRHASERIARYAFEYARRNGRSKVTAIHKANIMKLSDGLFLETCRRVAKEYPEVEFSDMIVDNTCMQLVSRPHQFDVMVMPNLYGTVVSNVACGLVGGLGLLSGRNYGDHFAVFEPGTRNTGTSVAGLNVANPIAMLSAACDMLVHLGLTSHAHLISAAINKTINVDRVHTADIGGQATSLDVVQNIIHDIQDKTKTGNWI